MTLEVIVLVWCEGKNILYVGYIVNNSMDVRSASWIALYLLSLKGGMQTCITKWSVDRNKK